MSLRRILPAFLNKGDTVGIIAPAGQIVNKDAFTQGIKILKEMGFLVKFPRDLWPGDGYLADCDENRVNELHELFRDPEIKVLLSARGGYGCLRLLSNLDLDLVRQNPKLIIGFSDITVLQSFLWQRLGLVSIHGPVLTSLPTLSASALERFFLTLTGKYDIPVKPDELEVIKSGKDVRGSLVGGNLASLVSLLGTSFDFSWENSVVLLEDINEPPYKIDRMFTQLHHAGKLKNLGALLLGDFSPADNPGNATGRYRYHELVWQRVLDLCRSESYPIWANLPYGHFPGNFAVPLGLSIEISHSAGTVCTRP